MAKVAAFFSAKLNAVQQNYSVHEHEMFAGVETMKHYWDILQGARFCWFTDHKGLIHLLKKKNLSGRQAQWLEAISEFDFEIVYVPGMSNILADVLSRIYSNDAPGTVRAAAEYPQHDEQNPPLNPEEISMPVLVGLEANAISMQSQTRVKPKWIPKLRWKNKPHKLVEFTEGDLPADPVSEDLGRQDSTADVLGIPSSEGMEGRNGSSHRLWQ